MYNKKEIMKRAHEIKAEDKDNIWGLCLKMAWAEAKAPKKVVKKGRSMKLENIKNGFYTDGENLYSNIGGKVCIWMASTTETENFLAAGNKPARIGFEDFNKEVKLAKAGMAFCNGEIVVIDKNSIQAIEVKAINPKYNTKGYCISHDGYKENYVKYDSKFNKIA